MQSPLKCSSTYSSFEDFVKGHFSSNKRDYLPFVEARQAIRNSSLNTEQDLLVLNFREDPKSFSDVFERVQDRNQNKGIDTHSLLLETYETITRSEVRDMDGIVYWYFHEMGAFKTLFFSFEEAVQFNLFSEEPSHEDFVL